MCEKRKTKDELVKIYNSFQQTYVEDILAIISDAVKSENFMEILSINDISSDKQNGQTTHQGFYMIFLNAKPESSECTCEIAKDKVTYYCVYRGEAYDLNSRLRSHLFHTKETMDEYPNCMNVQRSGVACNINIQEKKLYEKGTLTEVKEVTYPEDWSWGIVKIRLNDSKQSFRVMFEEAFDSKYGKPPFSEK